MSMTKKFKVEREDIKKLIRDAVNNYLTGADGGGEEVTVNGTLSISTGVSWDSDKGTVETNNNTVLDGFGKEKIDANELYEVIIKCLWNACCVYYQTYSYWPIVSGLNNQPAGPSSASHRGVLSSMHVTEEEYKEAMPQSKFMGEPYNIPMKSSLVKPFGLKEILDVLVNYNTNLETTIDHGTINSCYSSCHDSCHNSSRSRR